MSMELTDVTIREAAQMPGRSYDRDQRIDAGLAIDRLGVDRIQTGFPAAGEVERAVTAALSARVDAETVAIARALEGDVAAALEADADVVEVFAPLSDLHLEYDVGKSRGEVLEMLAAAVDQVRDAGAIARVGVVDAFRTDVRHLRTLFDRFPDVRRIGLADTVGCCGPPTVRSTLDGLDADPDRVSVHFHNDIALGVANVLAAYERGVGNADVSVAALGERVGNPALEEVVVAGDLEHDETFGVETDRLIPAAEEVLDALGESVSDRKPVLGREAVRHEAGLHTAVMLEEPATFEPFDPARFGGERVLVFGEGTGRGGATKLLQRAGVEPTDDAVETFLALLAERGPLDRSEAETLAREELGDRGGTASGDGG
ncbi:MAG: citramalate synthase [Halobacteriales archaeon]